MTAWVAVAGISLLIILVIAAVTFGVRRNRLRRERDETPQDRYRREILDIRRSVVAKTSPRSWRAKRRGKAGGFLAGGTAGVVGSAWVAGTDDGGSSDGGGCGGGGGGCGGGS